MPFERILENPDWKWDYEGMHIYPHIPMKKLKGAISAYAPATDPLDVLVLLDDTVFGGAREGMIVTRDGLYAKQKFEEPLHVPWRDIEKVEPETNSRIRVNGEVFFKADIIDHFAVLALASRLSHFVAADRGDSKGFKGGASDGSLTRELQRIHHDALGQLTRYIEQEYDASELDLHGLVDSHFQRIMQELPTIERALRRAASPYSSEQSRKSDTVVCVLLCFVVFHASAFARTSRAIKADLGESFVFLAGIHMQYRDFFLERAGQSLGVLQDDMREFFEIASMLFVVEDEETDFHLNVSRKEAIAKMMSFIDLSADSQRRIERDFDKALDAWWLHIDQLAGAAEDEEDAEDEDDKCNDEQEDDSARSSYQSSAGGGHEILMRHADVLGIRPGASRNEIELAYRGRRSQYHPDRYAGEGPEAVAWATGKMKEVNVAYQALIEAAD